MKWPCAGSALTLPVSHSAKVLLPREQNPGPQALEENNTAPGMTGTRLSYIYSSVARSCACFFLPTMSGAQSGALRRVNLCNGSHWEFCFISPHTALKQTCKSAIMSTACVVGVGRGIGGVDSQI
ncbi:hypothetical protein GOODEAATRI_003680 [Goodea atripinnis]|uniref:Uncharacterized protein n=1 Tax=Goodea atripinnis TaxID=208336 RepID=A0ABV0NH92_9TELE